MVDLDAIVAALPGQSRRKSGGGWMACCVCHQERSPSLSIDISKDGKLLVKCWAGCDNLDVLAALRKYQHNDYVPDRPKAKPTVNVTALKEWSPQAQGIWSRCKPITGTIAEIYLLARKCRLPEGEDIKFLPEYKGHPCMAARVTCPLSNKPLTLHFTSLKPDGSGKAETGHGGRDVLAGHRLKGGVIRLCDDESVTMGLGIAEGIETALNCQFWPIWAVAHADNMRRFPVLAGIESLTIFADHDIAGIKAAAECQATWQDAGCEARVLTPLRPKTDWADV